MIEFDMRALTDALVKLEGVCDETPQIAAQARAEALGHMIIGSEANIYQTPKGKYVRTGHYRQGLDARSRSTKNTATVTVRNDVDYAAAIEGGRDGLSFAMLQVMAMMRQNPHEPFTLGRSGVNWTIAGPIVIGAQVFAARRMQELFAEKVRAALR
ncbi:hypothetical protein DEIPH_ctg052orf0013 [Deinococcus phoenicis]|uniref:HK97 gp10 family phage protein n=1 Tax=Deinococcus phoenicis TaxID=1476583 RepID=A0A016QMN5_9DEIO|nr:hypothetical protein [Deinococcus phoenicis]EYB67019.1 hypothetical protein DEIPH_ctg052orf0013 [Deinococcus phoenicis]